MEVHGCVEGRRGRRGQTSPGEERDNETTGKVAIAHGSVEYFEATPIGLADDCALQYFSKPNLGQCARTTGCPTSFAWPLQKDNKFIFETRKKVSSVRDARLWLRATICCDALIGSFTARWELVLEDFLATFVGTRCSSLSATQFRPNASTMSRTDMILLLLHKFKSVDCGYNPNPIP